MADEPHNLALRHLRRIDRKVDGLLEEFRHFNLRVGSFENRTVSLHLSGLQQNGGIDRFGSRLGRIERRLDLVDD